MEPINTPKEEISIRQFVKAIADAAEFPSDQIDRDISCSDGILQRSLSGEKLCRLLPDFFAATFRRWDCPRNELVSSKQRRRRPPEINYYNPAMKNFVYLVQGDVARIGEYLHLRERHDADAIFLTYDQEREGCIFFPNSTWMQGRNRLLAEARKRGDYRYFIFMDDDVEFVRGGYGKFEALLMQLRPAVGIPVVERLSNSVVRFGSPFSRFYLPYLDWQIAWDYDGQMNAYHRDIILDGLAIPYWESFTDNWYMADAIPSIIARNFYQRGVLQFNRIAISNNIHRDYLVAEKKIHESIKRWATSQFASGFNSDRGAELSLLPYLRRLLLPFKSKYFRRDNSRGFIAPFLHLHTIITETRVYRSRESYRIDPQIVAERLLPDAPLYKHYLRHRVD